MQSTYFLGSFYIVFLAEKERFEHNHKPLLYWAFSHFDELFDEIKHFLQKC